MNKYPQDFYPTPATLAIHMIHKIDWKKANYILEPSAGSGNIVKQIREVRKDYRYLNIHVIEKDENLRNMLIGSGEKVVGKDFLIYAGLIQFDTIIMNPPFSNGEDHLLKAIEILYSGQIVCLLNAETIRNPYSNKRKDLVRKLKELEADIEYREGAFLNAERSTSVDIAIITIKIERNLESELLAGATDKVKEYKHDEIDYRIKDVAKSDSIVAIVDDYNFRVNLGIDLIHKHFINSKYVGSYFSLGIVGTEPNQNDGSIQFKTNKFLEKIRHSYWEKVLSLPAFEKRLTEKKRQEFRETIKQNSDLEFTVSNIRAFFENLMNSYQNTLGEAIEDLFDKMTAKHHWDESIHCKNVHYYNGWKSNDAFKVNKKVVMNRLGVNPYYSVWSNRLDYNSEHKFDDIDKVMNFFEGKSEYLKSSEAIKKSENIFTIIESEFFKIRIYKKGTTHLTFKSEDIRRRFNIEAGKRKGWLPADYGYVPFKELPFEKQEIVKSFEENVDDYDKNLNQIGFAKQELLRIGA